MRIIAGRLRRKPLRAPKGQETRPTSDRTRESIFNLIESRLALDGAGVLDLFAGTGALGIEALSRGAASVMFIEDNGSVLKIARHNADDLDVANACTFIRMDVVAFIKRYSGPPFDLILADPPYELEALPELPELVLDHLAPDGWFILEHDVRHSFDEHPRLDTSRAYGRTIVSVFAAQEG